MYSKYKYIVLIFNKIRKVEMKKAVMKKGFTLAEIMIALVVIGVITSILLPVAFNNVPNENVMKFKEGNATLAKVINELVTSGEYYKEGDLGVKADGTFVNSATFLCETMANIMNTKTINCSKNNENIDESHLHISVVNGKDNTPDLKRNADFCCKKYQKSEIITTDDITYFQVGPNNHFAINYKETGQRLFGNPGYWNDVADFDENGVEIPGSSKANSPFDLIYKVFCMDVDGINQGEDPFGYGIRADGKILLGKRAQEWIEKSIQEK